MEYHGLLQAIIRATRPGRPHALGTVEHLIGCLEQAWGRGHRVFYFEAMSLLSWRLYDVNKPKDPVRQQDLLLRGVELVFDKEPATPLEVQTEIIQLLSRNTCQDVDVDAWCEHRARYGRLYFRLWRRLTDAQDPDFDPDRVVIVNKVSPPPETMLRPGASPELIKDPRLRRQYEEAIAQNRRAREEFHRKLNVLEMPKEFVWANEHVLVSFYSTAPHKTDELKAYMDEYGVDDETKTRILKKVTEKIPAGAAEKPDTF